MARVFSWSCCVLVQTSFCQTVVLLCRLQSSQVMNSAAAIMAAAHKGMCSTVFRSCLQNISAHSARPPQAGDVEWYCLYSGAAAFCTELTAGLVMPLR